MCIISIKTVSQTETRYHIYVFALKRPTHSLSLSHSGGTPAHFERLLRRKHMQIMVLDPLHIHIQSQRGKTGGKGLLTIAFEMGIIGFYNSASHIAAGCHCWILYGGIVSRWHLEVFAAARECPLEVDIGRIRVDTTRYGHSLLQGGPDDADDTGAADRRICAGQGERVEGREKTVG